MTQDNLTSFVPLDVMVILFVCNLTRVEKYNMNVFSLLFSRFNIIKIAFCEKTNFFHLFSFLCFSTFCIFIHFRFFIEMENRLCDFFIYRFYPIFLHHIDTYILCLVMKIYFHFLPKKFVLYCR